MAENEGRSCDSENRNKRLKSSEEEEEEEEDRLSALPDLLIHHHILCLLPAIDLVKTCVLSKWWKNQWIRVPVLKFIQKDGMSTDNFFNFIDKTLILHNSPNIDKFVIKFKSIPLSHNFTKLKLWIDFAVRRDVKELKLILNFNNNFFSYSLPQLLFNNSSLLKLKLSNCGLMPTGQVNWESVNSLRLYRCQMKGKAIENVLSGSPLLQYLEFCNCDIFGGLVVDSKTLKTLMLDGGCSLCSVIEISCPNLERLRITGQVEFRSLKLMNLPSSVYATFDFDFDMEYMKGQMSDDDFIKLVQQTIRQVEHVEKLQIGRWLFAILHWSKENGDCVGDLSDSVLHRILSFMPPTKDTFKNDPYRMLECQWNDVPVLSFVPNEKFVIDSKDISLGHLDPRLKLWICLAARKDVKELILDCDGVNVESGYEYPFPQFLFNYSSLVKMKLSAFGFMPNGKVNWGSIKNLHLKHCVLGNQAIEHVLSGSPLLECLELRRCDSQGPLVVASEHLKTLILEEFGKNCRFLEISCPNLENFKIVGNMGSTRLKLTNLPSSVHATLDLYILESDDISPDDYLNLVEEIRKQILHVEEPKFGLRMLRS